MDKKLKKMKKPVEQFSSPECMMCKEISMMVLDIFKEMLKIIDLADRFIQNSIFSAFMISNLINDLLDLAKLENSAF